MQCLALDPQDRPQDAAELALALALDDAGHMRATRIAQIVRRFSVQPPGFSKAALAGTMLAGDQTMLAGDQTMAPSSAYVPPSAYAAQAPLTPQTRHAPEKIGVTSTFEGSSTVMRVDLPMTGMSWRKALVLAGAAAAVAMAVVGTNIAMARGQKAPMPSAQAAAPVAPPVVLAPTTNPAANPGTGTGTGTVATPSASAISSAAPTATASASATVARPGAARAGRPRAEKPSTAAAPPAAHQETTPVAPEAPRDVLDTRK